MGRPFTLFAAAWRGAFIITDSDNITVINKVRFIAVLIGIMLLISVRLSNIFPIRFSNYNVKNDFTV